MALGQRSAAPEIVLNPRALVRWVGLGIALVVVASIAGQTVRFGLGYDHVLGLIPLTYVDAESNLPTWYSAIVLLACALVTATIAAVKRGARDAYAWHWWLLAAGFAFLSLDEVGGVHEMIGRAARGTTWVVIATPFLIALALVYLRFLWSLPRATRTWLLLGGGLFLLGAMGFEVLGNRYRWAFGGENLTYVVLATIEELLEMVGIAIALYALLAYMGRTIGAVTFRFDGEQPTAAICSGDVAGAAPPAELSGQLRR